MINIGENEWFAFLSTAQGYRKLNWFWLRRVVWNYLQVEIQWTGLAKALVSENSVIQTGGLVISWSETLTAKEVNCPGATGKDTVALSFEDSGKVREISYQIEAWQDVCWHLRFGQLDQAIRCQCLWLEWTWTFPTIFHHRYQAKNLAAGSQQEHRFCAYWIHQ